MKGLLLVKRWGDRYGSGPQKMGGGGDEKLSPFGVTTLQQKRFSASQTVNPPLVVYNPSSKST